MAMLIPNDGEPQLLNDLLAGGSLENWKCKLFQSNTTPSETDVSGTYTEASFTGYTTGGQTLTRTLSGATWSTPSETGSTLEASDAKATYGGGTPISWSATSSQTVYGYFFVGATSGKLIATERFASSVGLVNGTTLNLTPVLELG